MATLINVLLEIVKITVPALIVYFTVHTLLKTYLEKQYEMKVLEHRQGNKNTTVPMRMQAYERLSLFCERISIPSLLLRLKEGTSTVTELRLKLLLAMQQEFEYNITQQVYVSDKLWQIIKLAREENMTIVNTIAEKMDAKAPADDLASALVAFTGSQQTQAIDQALLAIKKEATLLM